MQRFKGDATEEKFIASGIPTLEALELDLNVFYEQAYDAYPLGGVFWDARLAPLVSAMRRAIFVESFNEIFSQFEVAGTFESYLSVFRRIFGDDVVVEFTADNLTGIGSPPGPGKLGIAVTAQGFILNDFITRFIADNEYVFDEIVDDEGDNIAFQIFKGFETQEELEGMLRELIPAGIWADISLDFDT